MKAKYINPFLNATMGLFKDFLGLEVSSGKPFVLADPQDIGLTYTPDKTTPTFTWNSVQGANKYRLRIFNEAGNQMIHRPNTD